MTPWRWLLPFYPLFSAIGQWRRSKVPLWRRPQVLGIWCIKGILLEPLRWLEALVVAALPTPHHPPPVFIVGPFRSGTTFLQELLAAPPHRRTMTLFESAVPEVSLLWSWCLLPLFRFITWCAGSVNEFHRMPWDWNFPGEDDVALHGYQCAADVIRAFQFPSEHAQWLDRFLLLADDKDRQRWQRGHRHLFKVVAWKARGRQVVLKSPPNSARIAQLHALYPGARFIHIHRDPHQVLPSTRTLLRLNRPLSLEPMDEAVQDQFILHQFRRLVDGIERDNALVDVHVRFTDLIQHPMDTLYTVHQALGWTDWDRSEPHYEDVCARRKNGRARKYTDLPRAWRQDPSVQHWRTRWGYPEPTRDPRDSAADSQLAGLSGDHLPNGG